jgi:hypothetical protein
MLSSPVWRGTPRYVFVLGLVLGAVVAAAGLLVVGSLLRPLLPASAWAVAAAALAIMVVLREFGAVTFWLPENKRLVPEHVDRYGPIFGPLQFGFEMGTGMRTYLPTGLPHLLAAAVALLAAPVAALAAGLGFGVGRACMTVANLASLRRDDATSWDLAWAAHHRAIKIILVATVCLTLGLVLGTTTTLW